MAKNISKSIATQPQSMISTVSRIPDPEDYHHGRYLRSSVLPDNILMFSRTKGSQLLSTSDKHFHNRSLIIIPLAGSGRVIVNAQSLSLCPGECLLIPPYQFHHYAEIPQGTICWLFLTFEEQATTPQDKWHPTLARCTELFQTDLAEFIRLYNSTSTPEHTLELACRLSLLIAQLLAHPSAGTKAITSDNEELLLKVHRLISENLQTPLSMNDIAAQIGISESHLRSRFRASVGISLGNFQRTIRLRRAAILLNDGCNVTETATRCGWESAFSFSRAFAQFWGIPPKSFALKKRSST